MADTNREKTGKGAGKGNNPNSRAQLNSTKRKPGPGRKPLSEIEKAAREADRREISELWPSIKKMTLKELEALNKEQASLTVIKVAMIRAAINAIKTGDLDEVHRFYDRVLGRSTQPHDLGGAGGITVIIGQKESEV